MSNCEVFSSFLVSTSGLCTSFSDSFSDVCFCVSLPSSVILSLPQLSLVCICFFVFIFSLRFYMLLSPLLLSVRHSVSPFKSSSVSMSVFCFSTFSLFSDSFLFFVVLSHSYISSLFLLIAINGYLGFRRPRKTILFKKAIMIQDDDILRDFLPCLLPGPF